ncbi:MAG TPA: right-handed parallel beta-helix repeat-containing protein, partial [Nitrospirota bacterium]
SVRDCEFRNGVQGIAFARKARSRVENCTIKDMQNGGITCQLGAFPELVGNTLDSTGTGISCTQDSKPTIKNNTVSGCTTGLGLAGTLPAIEGNTLKNNKTGLVLSTGGGLVKGNRISGSQTGLLCQQFSNPSVEKNEIFGNSEGIVCFRASSPEIKNNEIYKNGSGISCVQLCNPKVSSNNIHDNKKGLFLDMSSYAVVHGNNIYANEVQLELGNMSSDWENKSKSKPERGSQAQNLTMASRGRAVPQQIEDGAQIMGFVDASGNWWGDATTAEMDAKGPNANIKSFIDYYDVPTRTYEGYSGIFVQDKVKYGGWKKSKIKINTQ